MAIDALVCGSTIGSGSGSGSGWKVDGSGGGDIGNGDDNGSGRDGIYGSGDEYDVSGEDGGVDMVRSLSTSALDGNGIRV
ncbi:hypothetical protein Tco_0705356 [Tanacetum coccineum]|uniref:Uncharacterized protein n=1 Tax=Tanacetum coccineum TaxID=301880 RepID=A0ABQ4Y577_9ASTR